MTKIDLQLDVKTDAFNAGKGKKPKSKSRIDDFRQILDEAVSSSRHRCER